MSTNTICINNAYARIDCKKYAYRFLKTNNEEYDDKESLANDSIRSKLMNTLIPSNEI